MIVRQILLAFALLVLLGGVVYGFALLDMENNFLEWSPVWGWKSIIGVSMSLCCSIIIVLISRYFLPPLFISLILIYLALIAYLVYGVISSERLDPGTMGRDKHSPWWFRVIWIMLLLAPFVSLIPVSKIWHESGQ